MGQLKDLKKVLYGDFIKWLETEEVDVPLGQGNVQRVKIGDCFSMDVWAQFILRNLMQIYSNKIERKKELAQFLASLPSEEMKKILDKRIEAEAKVEDKNSKIIRLPPGATIAPSKR